MTSVSSMFRTKTKGTTDDGKGENEQSAPPEVKIPVVTVKSQPRRHKVIQFGYTVTVEGDVPDEYRFQYPVSADAADELYPGIIPAGFSSEVVIQDVSMFLHTRQGMMSPEYQICYAEVDNVMVDWADSVDAQWMETLSVLEEYQQLSEESLDFLDADPLFLFGIADPSTQKALEKASSVPMLRCLGAKPVLGEWFAYLNADSGVDKPFAWVVESFADVELPSPWTSYKGVGSIVCYLNNETNETTWKHPFYDYFAQLLDHCRRATIEEHMKLRINRMLWSYEADCAQDIATQQPLISPKYCVQIADVLDVDLTVEPFMVGTLKTFLKAFSQQYRLEEDLDLQEIKWCREIVENERTKARIAADLPKDAVADAAQEEADDAIKPTVHAQLYCVESGKLATLYAPDCGDCFCEEEYDRIYAKGKRRVNKPVHIIPCSLCQVYPAKLQCTYTFGNFCHECYARKHVKTLPKFLDLKPVKIDYRAANPTGAGYSTKTDKNKPNEKPKREPGEIEPEPNHLGGKWHAFYDLRGCKYFYNFETEESLRRPQEDIVLEDWDQNITLVNLAQSRDAKKLRLYGTKLSQEKKLQSQSKKTSQSGHESGAESDKEGLGQMP